MSSAVAKRTVFAWSDDEYEGDDCEVEKQVDAASTEVSSSLKDGSPLKKKKEKTHKVFDVMSSIKSETKSMKKARKPLKPPDRWDHYSSFNKPIAQFLPFKVPLKKEIYSKFKPNKHFGWSHLFDALSTQGQKISFVINLCRTDRYYDFEKVSNDCPWSIQWKQIVCTGHGEIPTTEVINKFCEAVQEFKKNPENSSSLIGVHCTHGVNRTGFLICKYLIAHEGWNPKVAVETFCQSRGHSFDRMNYVNELVGGEKPDEAFYTSISVGNTCNKKPKKQKKRGFNKDTHKLGWKPSQLLKQQKLAQVKKQNSQKKRRFEESAQKLGTVSSQLPKHPVSDNNNDDQKLTQVESQGKRIHQRKKKLRRF